MEKIGDRLKSERVRLDYNQSDFAALAAQKKPSQIRYEAGDRSPDAAYLAAISAAGADVGYILTGERTFQPPDTSMLGVKWTDFVQVRYWRIGESAPMERVGEVAFLSAWLRGLTASPGECYLFHLSDDSMAPTAPQGATLMFDHSLRMPADDGIFVLRLDGGFAVRRLRQLGRQWLVECDNRAWPDRVTLTAKDAADRILGPAIWYGIGPMQGHG